ncbi:Hop family adhesin SabA/HopD [Helicobacter pylori]|uniref:Outer membrane protein HopD n=1 Tax=Helicobacter pylori (strain SouthAfrica7) TaxID=907239 RepID=E8QV56_HELPW|nr:SabA family sialic acid-binding adhesin [Helicobacter pylori]ADU84343.1 outer membrane protein HopD [Helicobacter pylori SouthAfrica7]
MRKTIFSLALSSLLVSTLSAEDDGFYMSAGYQIGEAAQMVKNTKGIQQLSDSYEKLSNVLTNYSVLNTLIQQSSDPNAINNARTNLSASAKNLLDEKTNSPAYQAVLLALNAAAGLWQVMSYAISGCGPGTDSSKNGGVQTFENTPSNQWGGTTITCGNEKYEPGQFSIISTADYATINKAYQIIQKAFGSSGKEIPVLSNTNTELKFTINESGDNGNKEVDTKNNAQILLEQANTIITTLNSACPWINNGGAGPASSGSLWEGINKGNGSACGIFKNEISAIQSMIANAQEAVAQAKIVTENAQSGTIDKDNKPFNPFNDASFAQGMLANATAQTEILNRVQQVVNDFDKIPKDFVKDSLGVCNETQNGHLRGTPSGTVTSNTWGAGCAYVGETITNLKNSIAHFGAQAEQIQQAEDLAYTLANFSSQYKKLGDTYNSITTAISSIPNAQAIQNVVSKKNNPYSPQGIQENFYLNQNTYNQVQTINQELGRNPFRKVGIVSSQTNNGAMNGIGIQVGYKQFFGQKRRWGARYYGFFDYNHAFIKSSFFNSASDVWTYGFGADALYNFINDKATNFLGKNNKLSVGLFGGIALAGTSWLNSEYVNLATVNNVYNAKMNVANFQFLFNMGLRMNLARPKKKDSDHAAQHGIELGLKIPTINTNYYSFMGAELKYRRLYSVYLNYVFAY